MICSLKIFPVTNGGAEDSRFLARGLVLNHKKHPYLLKDSSELEEFLRKLGTFSEFGIHRRQEFIRGLPKGLYHCTCNKGHHQIKPRLVDGVYRFETKIYGEYDYRGLFKLTSSYLVQCPENVSAIIEVNQLSESLSSFGKLRHHVCVDALESLRLKIPELRANGSRPCMFYQPFGPEERHSVFDD